MHDFDCAIAHIAIKVDNLEKASRFMKRCSAFAKPACCGPVDVSPKLLANISDDLARPNLKERDEWPPRIPCRPASVIRIVQ